MEGLGIAVSVSKESRPRDDSSGAEEQSRHPSHLVFLWDTKDKII